MVSGGRGSYDSYSGKRGAEGWHAVCDEFEECKECEEFEECKTKARK